MAERILQNSLDMHLHQYHNHSYCNNNRTEKNTTHPSKHNNQTKHATTSVKRGTTSIKRGARKRALMNRSAFQHFKLKQLPNKLKRLFDKLKRLREKIAFSKLLIGFVAFAIISLWKLLSSAQQARDMLTGSETITLSGFKLYTIEAEGNTKLLTYRWGLLALLLICLLISYLLAHYSQKLISRVQHRTVS